jgi:heme/copper-type cytochrome/quinol oxidase subunit 2
VVGLTLQPAYPREKTTGVHWIADCVGPRVGLVKENSLRRAESWSSTQYVVIVIIIIIIIIIVLVLFAVVKCMNNLI